jgi:hypothetical protein
MLSSIDSQMLTVTHLTWKTQNMKPNQAYNIEQKRGWDCYNIYWQKIIILHDVDRAYSNSPDYTPSAVKSIKLTLK